MEEKREFELKIFNESIEEIQSSVEERPSRIEDIEEIVHLRDALSKYRRKIEQMSEELKLYRL